MAATPLAAAKTEAFLINREWSEETVHEAMAWLAKDYQPISDMRATAAYRLQAAQNLLQRFWLETCVVNPKKSPQNAQTQVVRLSSLVE